VKMNNEPFHYLRLAPGSDFMGVSGQSYHCERAYGESLTFSLTLPNGVSVKFEPFGSLSGMGYIGPRGWQIYVDEVSIYYEVVETSKIQDAKLRAITETFLNDLLARAKDDLAISIENNKVAWDKTETRRREALEKLNR
jgi:hypothetical protein